VNSPCLLGVVVFWQYACCSLVISVMPNLEWHWYLGIAATHLAIALVLLFFLVYMYEARVWR